MNAQAMESYRVAQFMLAQSGALVAFASDLEWFPDARSDAYVIPEVFSLDGNIYQWKSVKRDNVGDISSWTYETVSGATVVVFND